MALETVRFEVLGVDWSAIGDKTALDLAIVDGCLWCYDFADPNTWPTQGDASDGDVFLDLTEGSDSAECRDATLVFENSGFRFTASGSQRIILPDAAKFVGNTTGYMVVAWLTFGTQSQAALSDVLSYYDHVNGDGPFSIITQSPSRRFFMNGDQVYNESWAAQTEAQQYALARVLTSDGWRHRVYKNKVMVADIAATSPTVTQPTVDATLGPSMGEGGMNGGAPYSVFHGHRIIGYDLDGWDDAEIDRVLDIDFSENEGRFA